MSVNTTGDAQYDFDVAIIGHGPVGVTAANLLGKEGIRTLVVERDKSLYTRARAVTVNDWTLRIFQDMGIDKKVKLDMDPARGVAFKNYTGKTVFQLGVHKPEIGQPPAMMIYQPHMEADLRTVGADMSSLDIRYGHTFTGLDQDSEGVTLDLTDDEGQPYQARVRYVIGSDGGQSRVREALGMTMDGSTRARRWIIIDGGVKNWWPDCNTLVIWSDPQRPMVDIPLAKGNHRWEIPLAEGERDEDFDEAKIWSMLKPLGITEDNVDIKGWAFYVHHVRHVTSWRKDRVVLLGDAAHLMPPWAGQGMQSGIRDGANAAWKLASIVRGELDESVLDTIETERRPHVEAMTKLATMLGDVVETSQGTKLVLRDKIAPLVMKVPVIGTFTEPGVEAYKFADGLTTGRPAKRNALGRMIPQPDVYDRTAVATPLDDVHGYGWTIYGIDTDPRTAMTAAQVAAWESLGARFVTVLAVRGKPTGSDSHMIVDSSGALRRWMKKYHAKVIAVRPDHFVAATDATGLDTPVGVVRTTPAQQNTRQKETVR